MQVKLTVRVIAEVPIAPGSDIHDLRFSLSNPSIVRAPDDDETLPLAGAEVISFDTIDVEEF